MLIFLIFLESNSETETQYNDADWYNGSIKSINLENFMCHSNFHLKLNPRINFISGLNGSGKSAIQAALAIGFGAKANITTRASSVKSFIKFGCSSATISITIANGNNNEHTEDTDPFKPEVYGRQITVVRQITETGSSHYKFLNGNGRIVKSSKGELKALVFHFNILVDNPICIMNQQMVKTFHKSANPKDKYDLFYKAISADTYYNQIEVTKESAKEYLEKLDNAKNVLKQCSIEVKEYEIYEKKSELLKNVHLKKQLLENEYAWTIVSKHEKIYKEYLQQIEVNQNNMSQRANKILMLEETINTHSDKLKELQNKLSTVEESRKHNHFTLVELQKELHDRISERDTVLKSIRHYETDINLLISDKKDLEKHIEVERQKGNTNTLAQYKEKLVANEKCMYEIEAAWKTNMEHEQALRNTVDDLKQSIGNLKDNVVAPMQRRIGELNRNINSMSKQQDRINFYGNWMSTLLQTIENDFKQNKFLKKPIGPIGAHIKVNQDQWIYSIENHLGRGILGTFLVDNFNDNKLLQSIMNKVIPGNARKPSVITSKFFDKIHNIAGKETVNSMFSMLTYTNPVVANSLIDNNRIEKIMLVEDRVEAMSLMENANKVPANCHFTLTADGTQVYPSPSYRVYSLQHPNEPVLLQSDVSIAVNNLKSEKNELEAKINNLNNEFDNIERSKNEKQTHLIKTQSEIRLLKNKYDEYSKIVKELKAKCEEEQDDRMFTLTEEMKDINSKMDKIAKEKEDALKPIANFESEIIELKGKLRNIKTIIDNTDRSALLEKFENLQSKIKNDSKELTSINKSLADKKNLLKDLVKKAENEKNIMELRKQEADGLCEKIEVIRNEEEIQTDMKEIKHKYQLLELELNKRGESALVVKEEYLKKKEEYMRHNSLLTQIKEMYHENKISINVGSTFLNDYIKETRCKVIEAFDLVLTIRKIKGKLDIDQHEESMVISMFDSSTSCASGGERTFATVALILALWNTINLPFYSIDEYDVYMDNVNRLATTDLLMMAIEKCNNQFIFLTPQDISHVKSGPNVKIVKLKEPRS